MLMHEIEVRKSVIAVLVTVILLGTAVGATSTSAQSTDGEIALSPTEVSLEQGESQTIAITYERLSEATPQGVEYTLVYDPNVISVADQEQGSYLGGRVLVNDASTPGEVEYLEAIFDGDGVKNSSGTIATITVEPTSNLEDSATTELEFATAKASEAGTKFDITTINGTVEAEAADQIDDSTNDESTGGERDTNNDEPLDDNTESSEKTKNSTKHNVGESKIEDNGTEPREPTGVKQTTNNNSTSRETDTKANTEESIPGFGITITVFSILVVNYVISKNP